MTIVERSATDALVERDEPLAQLHKAFGDAAAGRGRLILVSGEAGVGKTSLVRRFCDELPAGTTVLWGGCDALATPRPLGPFLEIAESSHGGFPGAALGPWSASHDVAATLLERGACREALVVVVEDVHWADEGTLDVIRLLGRKTGSTSCLVIVTYRDDELARDHPLRIALGDVSTAAAVERLPVRPLSRDGVARLADHRGADVDTAWRLTSGNPFYVTELLAYGAGHVPATVRDLVLARMAQLGPQATAVVEATSLAPPALDAGLLLAVCGEAADSVDECLASGILQSSRGGVSFRHELSRAAVEESLSPARRLALHRSVLLALMDSPRAGADLARIAHHAEEAADRDAVLRHAPAAADQAARAGAYREAAAQYARALRFGADLPLGERATLLEGRARACYLADDQREAIAMIREAVECRRIQGAPLEEARALTELTDYLWCRGYNGEADLTVARASTLAARRDGEHEVAARGMNALVLRPMPWERHDLVERYIDAAIEYCTEHTQDLWRINVLAVAARWALDRGRWDDAADHALAVIDDPRESPWTHHEALCVLALVRARRGDPGARDALEQAAAVGVPLEERFAHVDLAAARAEIAWLERSPSDVDSATAEMLSAASEDEDRDAAYRLLFWRRLAGLSVEVPRDERGPYGLALSDRWEGAAAEWTRRGCPYEASLALAQTGSVVDLRHAHAELQRIGARPLATVVARELRGLGIRDLPRGPRATTRANLAELTTRELEVLALVAEGLRNADIAERLYVSRRTVDHHVSAILRKLGAGSRGEAVASAQRLGLLADA